MSWKSALTKNLQELRVQLCQKGAGSQGARDFVLSTYGELKKANPTFPILIRECSGVQARLTARYDFGKEESVSIEGADKASIQKSLQDLIKKGESLPRVEAA